VLETAHASGAFGSGRGWIRVGSFALVVLVAEAVAVHLEEVDVVGEAVETRNRHRRIRYASATNSGNDGQNRTLRTN
jgi:hypothetical protein